MQRNLAFILAITGTLWMVLTTIIGGATFEGYNHGSQFISELGAREAPHERIIRFGGFLPTAILLSSFALLAFTTLPKSFKTTLGLLGLFIFSITYLAAVFFPCDPGCRPENPSASQIIHNLVGLGGYLVTPLSLGLLGWSAKSWEGGRYLFLIGIVGALAALTGLLTLTPESSYVGISQRLIETSSLTWITACGIYIRNLD